MTVTNATQDGSSCVATLQRAALSPWALGFRVFFPFSMEEFYFVGIIEQRRSLLQIRVVKENLPPFQISGESLSNGKMLRVKCVVDSL
ncbi:CLUMA_CG001596, isoform A [Clunio marinus]|uniref:CLUMA_CG001596, isoform A n=1 Tax=Clunio marinus TaxID=568069 RepID=A0A1J1HIC8_9DIPT|nr:CLUMA_CG001596, isoform A [Clunio marinus]